ncbi:MAG TPA: glutaredoxin family protein [Burkholderiales bacterium]
MRPPDSNGTGLRLTLYGRSYCHLCDEMLAALASLRGEFGFAVDVVDVDRDADLERRFGALVPVLMHADTKLCHYHLDAAKVRAYLAKIR